MPRQKVSPQGHVAWEQPLPVEEFHRRLQLALADTEQMQKNAELCAWFVRRYPTVEARLAYARRKYAEWTRESTLIPNDPEK
ncbi:MAG: hypothetical protein IPK82_28450 [Polyangiaceae bacterium]|nr:hypothetical protein [Polyangiaceae bacterium]